MREHLRCVAAGANHPSPDLVLIGAQHQDRVVELTRKLEWIPRGALRLRCAGIGRRRCIRREHRNVGDPCSTVDLDLHGFIAIRVLLDVACQRRQCNALRSQTTLQRRRNARGQRDGAFAYDAREVDRLRQSVYQPPVDRPLAAHAFGRRAKNIGEIAPQLALVGEPRKPAGARQDAQQRHLREAYRGGAIVDQKNLIAGKRQLVAAAGAGAVDRREEPDSVVRAGILHAVARFVGELAEVDFPCVRRESQHVDVGAGTEKPLTGAGDDDAMHFRMLEANAIERIGELDVDAEIVGIELELVARLERRVFRHPKRERRDRAVEGKLPVSISAGARIEAYRCARFFSLGLGYGRHVFSPDGGFAAKQSIAASTIY